MSVGAADGLDPDVRRFWSDVQSGVLPLRRCTSCGRSFVLPLPACPYCAHPDPELFPSSGRGELYSWVVVHHAFDPAFAADVPYVVAAVDLDEGARVYCRLEAPSSIRLAPGLRVVHAPDQSNGHRLALAFRPSDPDEQA